VKNQSGEVFDYGNNAAQGEFAIKPQARDCLHIGIPVGKVNSPAIVRQVIVRQYAIAPRTAL
jgi:hypothetical protein